MLKYHAIIAFNIIYAQLCKRVGHYKWPELHELLHFAPAVSLRS